MTAPSLNHCLKSWDHLYGAATPAPTAELSAEELAKLAQNPVGNLISVPFQNNTNLNVGPDKRTQNILNIQPVIPIEVNERVEHHHPHHRAGHLAAAPGWRSHQRHRRHGVHGLPVAGQARQAWIWGAGPVVQIPTNSNSDLGNRNWGLGPSVVVLHLDKGDPWVYGVLANNIWSLSDSGSGGSYNNGLIQPFRQLQLPGGFYVTSAPIITVNWKADSSQRWTVPLGGGVGKIFHLGKLPVNTQLSAYYNVVKPG
jgi:hypothetical protein